jgi:hypothetical protein
VIIRQHHLRAFENALVSEFAVQMTQHLRRVLPRSVDRLEDGALRTAVVAQISRAMDYGLTDRFNAMRYIESCALSGSLDNGPDSSIDAILSGHLGAEEKMDLVEVHLGIV